MKTVLAVMGVSACSFLAGCVGWANYPPEAGQTRFVDPNDRAMARILGASLEWAARKYPAYGRDPNSGEVRPGPFTVNLPGVVQRDTHDRILEDIGHGVVPLTPQTSNLPTYHVLALRVRGDEGQVTFLRPVPELGGTPTGGTIYQEIRVMLRGGVNPWRVTGFREWSPDTAAAPPSLNYYASQAASASEPK